MTKLTLNGRTYEVEADPEMPLLWAIRDHLNLTGTKYGCGIAQCGACTVHLDGQPVRACQTRLGDVGEAKITTIEGISGPVAEAVRTA
ncbi:(2Fe-2S)-binding protein, partial [Methylobacterium indicum]